METSAKTPTVAIARILRSLNLAQGAGKDFRIAGMYHNGQRIGTHVLILTRHAHDTIVSNADLIEERAAEAGWSFKVSVRYFDGNPHPFASVANCGERVRMDAPHATTAPEPQQTELTATYSAVRNYLGKRFTLCRVTNGGRRWTEGAAVRKRHVGTIVGYTEAHGDFRSDGGYRQQMLEEVRAYLGIRYTVADYSKGWLLVTPKPQEIS